MELNIYLRAWTARSSIRAVSIALGLARPTIYAYLKGETKPDPEIVVLWAAHAGVSDTERREALNLRAGLPAVSV